jgi:hypothetical protein
MDLGEVLQEFGVAASSMTDLKMISKFDSDDIEHQVDSMLHREYMKRYMQNSENREKVHEYKRKYKQRPYVKEKRRIWEKSYYRRPEILEKKRTEKLAYMKKRYHLIGGILNTKRRILLHDLKLQAIAYKGGKCVDCGFSKHLAALCFHHVDGGKKDFTPKEILRKGFEQAKPELDKCILLCFNCHQIRHFKGGD